MGVRLEEGEARGRAAAAVVHELPGAVLLLCGDCFALTHIQACTDLQIA